MSCEGFGVDFPAEFVEEGEVRVLVPKLEAFVKLPCEYAPSKAPVFYNPVMELNRDFAVLALQAYQKMVGRDVVVCEPLAACGLRGIRFAVEVRGVGKVVLGDINERAYRLACRNVQMNGLADQVSVNHDEANFLLSSYSRPRRRFDFIDVDPFGSPVPFLDSAVRALRNGGLLALTATDMAPLCGVHSAACVRKYGGRPLRTEYCHELAVRLLAGCLARVAARFDVGVDVVFSHRAEHYVRVYAVIKYGAKKADSSLNKLGFVLHCFKCFHRETVKGLFAVERDRTCVECGSRMSFAGPMWLGRLFDAEFCSVMEAEAARKKFRFGSRIRRVLGVVRAEVDAPVSYFVVDRLCDSLGLPVPAVGDVVEALRKGGFEACFTHFNSRGVRTDASASKVKETVRSLAKEKC
jgi:tRNA (guanine26-N2/guanine27-N2)-dimethyltransferase